MKTKYTITTVLAVALLSLSLASMTFAGNALAQQTAGNNQTARNGNNATGTGTAATGIDCDRVASQLGGQAIPNPAGQEVCDVSVLRESLNVADESTGMPLNKLLVANSLFEFMAMPNASTAQGNNQTALQNETLTFGMAEFALLERELPSVMRTLSNSSLSVVAVHNHMLMESPKMVFVHAMGMADTNTLVDDARSVLDQLESQQETRAAGNNTNAATSGGDNQTETTFGPQGASIGENNQER